MNFGVKLLRRAFCSTFRMDSMDDYLYYSNEKLQNFIRINKDDDLGVQEYLKSVKYSPIEDFKTDLEWFNVSQPLSFAKHLKGKVVVLDFFTYCCINCMHILPDLKEIESKFSVEDGLVVIGVHSAKFENEKNSSNILSAVQRYGIGHPVVNDCNSEMWKNCDVHCWPTLLMLGPNANPIVMLTGEGHKEDLMVYIKNALAFYKEKNMISDHKLPLKSAYHLLPDLKGPLLFPGKITNYLDENDCEILAVSDTGNNRIIIFQDDGTILQQIGGRKLGFKDGSLDKAEFNNPQGLVFQNKDILLVADTENHAIRKIDLKRKVVETVAGTGVQGHDRQGGKLWKEQPISSPWDVSIFKTPDMDLTFHPEGKKPIRDVLIIAMAGTHQIWALFLEDTVWWKCKKYTSGTCINIAGSGREENRNNLYPHAAAFAQPSGLALCQNNKEVYIADSESSSVRRLSLIDGKVTPVVGGDRNPNNLFSFGDKDGTLFDAKLQHLLGLGITKDEKTLFVVDTYNHKLKKVDISQNIITTVKVPTEGTSHAPSFKEPAGLCVSSDNKKLYVADTNNHSIKVLYLNAEFNVSRTKLIQLRTDAVKEKKPNKKGYELFNKKPVSIGKNGGKLVLAIKVEFQNGLGLTEGAPQSWFVDLPNATWSAIPKSGNNLSNIDVVVTAPSVTDNQDCYVDFLFDLVTCTSETCLPKSFIARVPIKYSKVTKTTISDTLSLSLTPSGVTVQ